MLKMHNKTGYAGTIYPPGAMPPPGVYTSMTAYNDGIMTANAANTSPMPCRAIQLIRRLSHEAVQGCTDGAQGKYDHVACRLFLHSIAI